MKSPFIDHGLLLHTVILDNDLYSTGSICGELCSGNKNKTKQKKPQQPRIHISQCPMLLVPGTEISNSVTAELSLMESIKLSLTENMI